MTEFVSRWLPEKTGEPANQRTDKTDKTHSVGSVGASEEEFWHVFSVDAAIAELVAADPVVLETAGNIVALTPAERERYRGELDAAAADDPFLAHDRAALSIAELRIADAWPPS